MDHVLLGSVLFLVSAGAGVYLGTYLKKKGENFATHEDIDRLVDQVGAATRATKEIESKISSELWDRKKRWELKRDVLFDTTRRVSAVYEALKGLEALLQSELKNPEYKNTSVWTEVTLDRNQKWFAANAALEESKLLVGLSCSQNVVDAIEQYSHLTSIAAAQISKDNDGDIFKQSGKKILELRDAVRDAIRKELGADDAAIPGAPGLARQAATRQ